MFSTRSNAGLLMLILGMSWGGLFAQSKLAPGENLIPNPSFEVFSHPPEGWYYSGRDFSRTVKNWFSPTGSSPDAYGPGVTVPESWVEKGFGLEKPRSGKAMAGITVYGCDEGKPHCREYIQVRLAEPLVYGQRYELSFWVKKLPRGGAVDNIGVAFSDTAIHGITSEQLFLEPAWECKRTAGAWVDRWQRIGDVIQATGEERYILIGNFRTDEKTVFKPARKESLAFAYYYIDDVALIKKPPYLVAPVFPEDLELLKPETGMLVRMKGIYFDTDKSDIRPEAIIELNKLVKLMQLYPKMVIEVLGHTDIQGGDAYNFPLSDRRAESVANYLMAQGIEGVRLKQTGRGAKQPIATNATPEGRQKNRRVEFLVLEMN